MHYAENKCAMPIRLHCNELRALCLTTNALCRTAEIGALLLKCVLIVYIWPEKGVDHLLLPELSTAIFDCLASINIEPRPTDDFQTCCLKSRYLHILHLNPNALECS